MKRLQHIFIPNSEGDTFEAIELVGAGLAIYREANVLWKRDDGRNAMSHRLNKAERHYILREMIELARFLTTQNVPPPKIRDAVKHLRDDLLKLRRAGITEIAVDKESYLEPDTDQEKGEAR